MAWWKSSEPGASWLARLSQGLSKARNWWSQGISRLFQRNCIDNAFFEDLEEQLIAADLGWELSEQLTAELRTIARNEQLHEPGPLRAHLQRALVRLCTVPLPASEPQLQDAEKATPRVILLVGVNGAGKTTTVGKLAAYFQEQGQKLLLAAADTFRAAAIEQLHVWAERTGSAWVAQQPGADAAAVAFDAVSAAKARKIDCVLIDTAGRLHNKQHLMEELLKIKRVVGKSLSNAPHEIWLVLDATAGQNALQQVQAFHDCLQLTGLIMTKWDGTAKAGVLFQICHRWSLPVVFIGVGEGVTDLRPFDAEAFVAGLLATESSFASAC